MESNPIAGDFRPRKGAEWKSRFRKPVGDCRIVFTLDGKAMTVAISAILIRSERTYR